MTTKKNITLALMFLFITLGFLSINGMAGGALLIIKPDGSLIGMKTDWLSGTPFNTFLIPGICLLLLNGAIPLLALTGLITRKENRLLERLNLFNDKHWSWTFTVYSGIITISWIIIQQLITEYFILQPIISAVGLINLVLALSPGIQTRYTRN
jgi:hypothetical protein